MFVTVTVTAAALWEKNDNMRTVMAVPEMRHAGSEPLLNRKQPSDRTTLLAKALIFTLL